MKRRGCTSAAIQEHMSLDSGCIGAGGDETDGIGDSSQFRMRAVSTLYGVGWLDVTMLVVNLRKPF